MFPDQANVCQLMAGLAEVPTSTRQQTSPVRVFRHTARLEAKWVLLLIHIPNFLSSADGPLRASDLGTLRPKPTNDSF